MTREMPAEKFLGLDVPFRQMGWDGTFPSWGLHVPRYGWYCGPGWTGGVEGGEDFELPGRDALDSACRLNDAR